MKKHLLSEESYLVQTKAKARQQLNTALLGISFTVFALVITLKPELIKDEILSIQLVLAIPLIISSIFARIRLSYAHSEKRWELFGYGTFIIAYSFLINTMGILLASVVSLTAALGFFAVNIVAAILYSAIEISYSRKEILERVVKDAVFFGLVTALGILPSLAL
jgi:hypothetical protein